MNRTALLAIAAVLAAAAAYVTLRQEADPPAAASAEPQTMPGMPMVAVTVPEFDGDAVLGARAYEAFCSSCHGPNGAGREGFGPPLVHRIYEPSHHGDAAFERAAASGVQQHHWGFGNMPPVAGISGAEVQTITAYIRALQRANGIE